MKKLFALILAIVLLLPGCGTPARKYFIEEKDWQIVTVQSAEDGRVLFIGDGRQDAYPDAEVIALSCKAEGGRLTFTTADQTHEGSYALQQSDDNAAIYTVTVGEETGPAAVSVTTYGDGRAEQTLVLQLGGYSLYFAPAAGGVCGACKRRGHRGAAPPAAGGRHERSSWVLAKPERAAPPTPYPGIFRLNSTICISIPQKIPHRHHLG